MKYAFEGSSRSALASNRRVAEINVGDARYVFLEGMNLKLGLLGRVMLVEGSEWT